MLDKKQLRADLLRTETNIVGIITNGIVHSTPKRTILKQITKEIAYAVQKFGLERIDANQLYLDSVSKYTRISKKTFSDLRKINEEFGKTENYDENLVRRSDSVYKFIRKDVIRNDSFAKIVNQLTNQVESRQKREEIYGIEGFLKRNQENQGDYSPFFLCSSHIDPAEDHKNWEGKMYYDEDWKKYVTDKATRKKISAYIHNRKLHTVQWVCGEPVYMITRPNCRHFFTKINIEEALGDSPKNLVKKHKLYNKVEEVVLEEKVVLKRYLRRLDMENHLSLIISSEKLLEDIKNDTKLVNKWKKICEYVEKQSKTKKK